MGQLNTGLANRFTIESHLLSTRSADASKAIDRERGIGVCLWTLRHPLPLHTEAVQRFMSRLSAIRDLEPPISTIQTFGVDPSGIAYAVMPPLDGVVLDSGNLDPAEAERRFISCLKLIDRLHSVGIVCGDLCSSSFLVARGGDLRFIGVMGSFDAEAAATAMLPPMETLNFLAPEQRAGGVLEATSDVFALGVLGYRLLTGAFPYPAGSAMFTGEFDPSQIKPISAFTPLPPVWAEEVLMRCLDANSSSRYPSAGEVLRAISEVRQQVEEGRRAPQAQPGASEASRRRKPTRSGTRPTRPERPDSADGPQFGSRSNAGRSLAKRNRRVLTAGVAVATISAITTLILFTQGPRRDLATHNDALRPLDKIAQNTGLSETVPRLNQATQDPDKPDQEQLKTQLSVLTKSDDPLAHELLVKLAKRATVKDARDLSEAALLERARRLGLKRSSEQVRQWLRTVKDGAPPAAYESVLRSLDTTLPLEARAKTLTQTYASNPQLALRLTASLALDSPNPEEYRPLLTQLLLDQTHNQELSGRSLFTLILVSPELALIYQDEVLQRKDLIPDQDTLWILKVLAERSDQSVRAISELAIERNLLSPVKKRILLLVRDRADLPSEIQSSLIHAAAGAVSASDIANFGRWYDTEAERVLLSIMAEASDKSLLTDTFDTLAGKSLTIEPSAGMLAWVRQKRWDSRAEFARAIGILGSAEVLGDETIAQTLPSLDQAAKDRSFLDLLVSSPKPALVRLAVDRYRDQLGVGGLINLLGNQDQQVRVIAVKSLKDVNEIAVLKIILDKYDAEKDPVVRKAYQDTFWMIQGREGRK